MTEEIKRSRGRPLGKATDIHRYQYKDTMEMFADIRSFAQQMFLTFNGALLKLITIGIYIRDAQKNGATLIIKKKGEKDREIIII